MGIWGLFGHLVGSAFHLQALPSEFVQKQLGGQRWLTLPVWALHERQSSKVAESMCLKPDRLWPRSQALLAFLWPLLITHALYATVILVVAWRCWLQGL